jgi:CPA1 family monovalent cation:H+ antiporter
MIAVCGLIAAAAAIAGIAHRFQLSAPLVLVVVGAAASAIPGVPDYALDPSIALFLILPPLVYSAALDSSYLGFRKNLRPIGLLSVGLVLFTTVVVGYVVHWAIPDIPLAAAFALGAIVAPPDAVAAIAVGRSLGLPRRVLTILGGEGLVNDATALTAYRVASAAAIGEGFSLLQGAGMFLLAAVGGVAIGLLLAPAMHWLRLRMKNPVLENVLSVLAPFVGYLVAETVHASGVLTVVTIGLYLGHRENRTSPAARLIAHSLWKTIDFVLESVVFLLIGMQLPVVLRGLAGRSPLVLVAEGLLVTALVIVLRVIWVFPGTFLPRILSRRISEREQPAPTWRTVAVVSWAGMRGVVSLAAAFALVERFPARDLVLWLTFCVVLGTLVGQGFTLPWLIRKLGVSGTDPAADNLAEAAAQQRAARAAIERLDVLVAAEDGALPGGVADQLREWQERQALSAWERLGSGAGPGQRETPSEAFRRLRREMLDAERAVFVELRDAGRIDDEVLRRVQRELDFEDAMYARG